MALPRTQQARDKLRRAERNHVVLQLRIRGMNYRAIAAEMRGDGYRINKSQVCNVVNARLDELRERDCEAVANIRELEIQRLDAMLDALWPLALGDPETEIDPDLGAVDKVLKLADRRAKLMGLDAPRLLEIDDTRDRVEALSGLLDGLYDVSVQEASPDAAAPQEP